MPDQDMDRAPDGFGPGVLTTSSGEQWIVGEQIGGWPADPGECDAESPSAYRMPDGSIRCRCIVCSRCGHHTGNSNQGHYWASCNVDPERREFHLCCPEPFGCELEAGDA
jgi:hypothetical protein